MHNGPLKLKIHLNEFLGEYDIGGNLLINTKYLYPSCRKYQVTYGYIDIGKECMNSIEK